MPNTDVVEPPAPATCCRCASPAEYTVLYDIALGVFAEGLEPRLCKAHNDELLRMNDAARAEALRDFPLAPAQPRIDGPAQPQQIRERI
ncbi:MAG: hypothetical protein IT338_17420 [Thermomicrobiales bacterium]|nr:hypothetical protein [Thermomicrobiales bacterium]